MHDVLNKHTYKEARGICPVEGKGAGIKVQVLTFINSNHAEGIRIKLIFTDNFSYLGSIMRTE